MMMTSSPMLEQHQHFASPGKGNSPSPSLRSSSGKAAAPASGTITPLSLPQQQQQQQQQQQRSYARAPTQRPYGSPHQARGRQGAASVDPTGDTKKFGELVASMVDERTKRGRKGGMPEHEHGQQQQKEEGGKSKSVGGSLAGSWEKERAELIVDVPVWSPGCFQDLSTLHALRDTTLAHTHSLLGYLHRSHSLASSYRLLARSTVGASRTPVGWGCIRLAPSNASPVAPLKELKPLMRRSSTSLHRQHRRRSSAPVSPVSPIRTTWGVQESAIVDEDDEDEEVEVKLKGGYISGSGSDAEEEETADEIIIKELERRGSKEGSAFLMTVFGQPALILT